jgi:hypothetical protein
MSLDKAVHCLTLQFRRVMLSAIPARIGCRVGEAEIGGEIDDLDLRRLPENVLDDLLGRRMGQRAEHEIEAEPAPVEPVERHELRQRERRELQKYLAHLLARFAVGGQQRDRHLRVAQQKADAFRSGIARGAEHADFGLSRRGRCWKQVPRR